MTTRGKAIEDLKQLAKDDWILHFNDSDVKETAKAVLALLKEQPEIVRCRDCKHWSPEHEGLCPYNDIFTVPDWFCADGERKDDVRLTEAMADRPY